MKYPYANPLEIQFSTSTRQYTLPKGTYILEAYGASGGGDLSHCTTAISSSGSCLYSDQTVDSQYKGNSHCFGATSRPGSGAYVKGKLTLSEKTTIYVTTGGQGNYGTGTVAGGHNGGGKAQATGGAPAGSGGGATDFRVLKNSLFNRFLVAGAGGGSDNSDSYGASDDGSGGSGGLPGQGFWQSGSYQSQYQTTSTSGFSFGYGQNYKSSGAEAAGAGSGFYGGYTIASSSAGASGGSSFALTNGASIPQGQIIVRDGSGNELERGYYALTNNKEYYLTEVVYATGVWIGNGKARITYIEPDCITCKHSHLFLDTFLQCLSLTLISST